MANVDNPNGCRPLMRSLVGGPVEADTYSKLASYGKAVRKWDAVTLLTTGYLGVAADITPGTTPYVGVAMDYGPVSTLTYHEVIINPFAVFDAQDDDGTTGLVLADRGQTANLLLTDGGTPNNEDSANEIDQSTAHATNVCDVKLLKLSPEQGNAYGAHSRWEFIFNRHMLAHGTGVAGI